MRLAIVNNDLGSGGAEKLIYDMSLRLKNNKDIEFDIIILNSKNEVYKKELEKKGINIISLDSKFGIYNPLHIFKLRKILKNYNVVHGHVFPSQYWVGLAAKLLPKNIKFVTTEHNTTNGRRGKRIFKYLDSYVYKSYEKIISISEETQKNLLSWINQREKFKSKFYVIENGVNLIEFKKNGELNRKNLGYSEEDKILIMISRFNKQKDHKTVISALELLPENYKLMLLGEGELKREIKKYALEKNVVERVKFLGFKKNIVDYLKISDIGIQSSNYEGFGLTSVEIMASGIPLLASDVEGMKNIVYYKELLFKKGDFVDLSYKIMQLESIENQNQNKELGKNRSERYSIEKMIEKYKEVYR